MIRVNWNQLLKVAEKYREDAEKCLEAKAYYAGLVCVRASLEALLIARILLGLFDLTEEDLQKYHVKVRKEIIEIPDYISLKDLIEEAYKNELITKTGYNAATRIREWGNKIHSTQVANSQRLPSISERNLKARLDDLALVTEELLRSL